MSTEQLQELTQRQYQAGFVTDVEAGSGRPQHIAACIRVRTNDVVRTVKPCGPGAPVLASSATLCVVAMRGQTSRSPRRARSKPSNYRAGKAGSFGQTCGDCRLLFFCRRAMGAVCTRPSLCPLNSEGRSFQA